MQHDPLLIVLAAIVDPTGAADPSQLLYSRWIHFDLCSTARSPIGFVPGSVQPHDGPLDLGKCRIGKLIRLNTCEAIKSVAVYLYSPN
jgi:hypothetical protein